MKTIYKICYLAFSLLLLPTSGCTLKLTTDLSKIVGIDNPEKLMGSEEAQQIATKIGEGMGTKIMEGEILAEDMGKGLGKVLLEPQKVAIIEDPVSVDIIEKSGISHIKKGNFNEAISSFKRTNNLSKLEELALILFDKGDTKEATDLHQYLIDRNWPIQPSYLVTKNIEYEELATIQNKFFKEIDPEQYNQHYNQRKYSIFDAIPHIDNYIKKNSITRREMLGKLSESPVIILADAYFVVKQHEIFLGIIKSLDQRNLIIGLESQLQKLKDDDKKAGKLNYLPIFTFIEENDIPTFTHGPGSEADTKHASPSIDFFKWDKSLAEKTTDLLKEGKQVLIIIGDTHASSDHLPFLIEEISGINPALVIQNPLNLSVEQILEGNCVFHQQLTAWGLSEDRVLTIENDFYLNTEVPIKDLKQYIKLFNLENSLRVKQRKVIHRRDSRDK
jgi:tetratricopeptide (TPR) repeat protein